MYLNGRIEYFIPRMNWTMVDGRDWGSERRRGDTKLEREMS